MNGSLTVGERCRNGERTMPERSNNSAGTVNCCRMVEESRPNGRC